MSLFTLLPVEIQDIIHDKLSNFDNCVVSLTSKHYGLKFSNLKLEHSFVDTSASLGYLELLKLAREYDYSWGCHTCSTAASNGQLECLKYLHENGCPWDRHTIAYAASNGHLECLKYLHEDGYPWGKHICLYAELNGHTECVEYLRGIGYSEHY